MPPVTTEPIQFDSITPDVPDLEALAQRAGATRTALEAAGSVDECVELLREWDTIRCEVESYGSIVDLHFNQDTKNADYKSAREAWDEASPRWTELEIDIKRALLAHPLRVELQERTGAQAFALWESEILAFNSAIKTDLAKESALDTRYTELTASVELEFQGEKLNLSELTRFRQHADRDVRHGAEQVFWSWFAENRPSLDQIFDDMVALRDGMAKKLGFNDYVELGYKRMCRVDYDKSDVERFRAEIVRDVVPLAAELSRRQARDLGVDPLMSWDEYVHDLSGNPRPQGDLDWCVERAQEMFDSMGGGLGEFFKRMTDGGFLDLAARKGKATGGFCTSFPTHGMPFVYANFNGTKGDVEVLTHEIGHAFQNYSSRNQWPMDYFWPTFESCEVHSMGLEFLTWPHMDAFFGEDGERFRRVHLTESLLFLPYGTAVDHFQHEIYENPTATPDERHAMWKEMERIYLPWRDYGDLAHPAMGGRWQYQAHIYHNPFYYIDYVLAQTCALQFWANAERDRDATMKAYVDLCERGGSAPFQELVRSAGLTSPFDAGCLSDVVDHARKTLGV